ncbi:hypothetical protein RU51_20140 [Salmonella enterica subsp. enterica serovar Senftenberg]|nr:hypothetical protein [Salmonella enterica subsp. enterica serovar Senftenberg]EDT3773486.1 hypothetical protein [Salmonella enterica subsp. enterica serovar Gaminara]
MKGKNIVARVVWEAAYKWETRHQLTPTQCPEINQLMRQIAALDAMPGFDRDWATNVIADAIVETKESQALVNQPLQVTQLPETYFFDGRGNTTEAYFLADDVREMLRAAGVQFSE